MQPHKPARYELANRAHRLGRDLAVCLPFLEGASNRVYDLSGNKRHSGTFMGDAISWIYDATCGAWTIDFGGGADYFDIPFRASQGKLSVALRINHDLIAAVTMAAGLHDGTRRLYLGNNGSYCFFGFGNAYHSTSAVHGMITHTWYTLVATGDGATARYYVDCVEKDSFSYTWTGTAAADFRVGEASNGNYDFNGSLAWVMIWERCLHMPEIKLLQCNPFSMFQTPGRPYFASIAAPAPARRAQPHIGFKKIEGADRLRGLRHRLIA